MFLYFYVLLHDFRPVRRQSVPDEEEFLSSHVAFQVFQKAYCLFGIHVSGDASKKEARVRTLGIGDDDTRESKLLPRAG